MEGLKRSAVKKGEGATRRAGVSGFTMNSSPIFLTRFPRGPGRIKPGPSSLRPESMALSKSASGPSSQDIGLPLGIREVAQLLGYSPWSVRQRLIPLGLPHFRCGPRGKFIFYRNAVLSWLEDQQREGAGV
jgi:hypothetical protein